MDATSGMGFGTTISPILLLRYPPLTVIPTLLISQTLSGFVAAIFHEEFENVKFFAYPLPQATKVMLSTAILGCVGVLTSIMLVYYSLKPPAKIIKVYVSFLLLLMGVLSLLNVKKRTYSKKILLGFAAIAGVNKGIGGGGYGPIVTLGQTLSGIYEKSAVGITTFAEAITSLVGSLSFILLSLKTPLEIELLLLPSIFTGSFFASIFSPYAVRIIPNKFWRVFIPAFSLLLGFVSLFQVLTV